MNEPDMVRGGGTKEVQWHEVDVTASTPPHDQGPQVHQLIIDFAVVSCHGPEPASEGHFTPNDMTQLPSSVCEVKPSVCQV